MFLLSIGGWIGIAVFVLLVIVLISWVIKCYNGLVQLRNKVRNAFSQVDVQLKRRADLIPNIVEIAKGYGNHEKSIIDGFIRLRKSIYDNMSINEKFDVNNKVSLCIDKLMAVAEAYPELKSSDSFMDLSKQLTQIEEDIANARKYYNGTVREYNTAIQLFPAVIIANILNFKEEKLFEIDSNERDNVKVTF